MLSEVSKRRHFEEHYAAVAKSFPNEQPTGPPPSCIPIPASLVRITREAKAAVRPPPTELETILSEEFTVADMPLQESSIPSLFDSDETTSVMSTTVAMFFAAHATEDEAPPEQSDESAPELPSRDMAMMFAKMEATSSQVAALISRSTNTAPHANS